MQKNISSLLQRGNLTPKERMLLLIHDAVKQEQGGRAVLTDADKHALSEGWAPKDNDEVAVFNRYNEGWKNAVFAELDAQTTYLIAENDYLKTMRIIYILLLKNDKKYNAENKIWLEALRDKEGEPEQESFDVRRMKHDAITKNYAKLLAFTELFKRLSKTFKIDLTYKISEWIQNYKNDIEDFNEQTKRLNNQAESDKDYAKLIKVITNDLLLKPFNPDEIKPDVKAIAIYFEKFKEILGDDF